ncbi:DUF983 domain-containing protein [Pedobacter deserti]|nr:DUF983 domain-containing protein [Pedobacter sp. SYSU D00382]
MKPLKIDTSSEFSAAMHAKCPRCRRGNMFDGPMYGFKLQKMHVTCPHCGLRFEREPGYFYVSMFISYAMNVAEIISIAVATYVLTGNLENMWLYIATIFPAVLILSPFNYRFSRVILLYWLTPGLHYNPEMSRD